MKISYKVLKKYINNLKNPEEIAQDLIMHTAEVEEIIHEWENLKDVIIWEIIEFRKHSNSDKLNCTRVNIWDKILDIVCWASNVRIWLKVAVAIVWAKLKPDFEIQKTKIRWETSEWMICSEDELSLIQEKQEWIFELPNDATIGICIRDYLKKNDSILEIDNKAINHRPDLFSHIGIIRELFAINWEKFDFKYAQNKDFSQLNSLNIINEIQNDVKIYVWLKIEWVSNIETPEYIKQILSSWSITSKWLLIDISNYSLYLYWQPTHCFDAEKINWNIIIRFARDWEIFLALDNKEYKLKKWDIVIADDNKILALWWIIGWKESAVSEITTKIIIEWAHFNQATIRKTWKRLWIRTDSLNVFEKDLLPEMAKRWVSLIAEELSNNIKWVNFTWYSESYNEKQKIINIDFDLSFINNLIWKKYSENEALKILNNLWFIVSNNKITVPFWRKDIIYKADIAEEIARIDWYNNIEPTVPRINIWAVIQDNIYKLKNDSREFFTARWFFDIYNYSFVNENLMKKLDSSTKDLIDLKNALSEELTHMKDSHIPNLLESLEKNLHEFKNLKLIEIEKVFYKKWSSINENYSIAWVITSEKDIIYYDIQSIVSDYLKTVWVNNYYYDIISDYPSYVHKGRTSKIVVRGVNVWIVWEIHSRVCNNFWINNRVWFFEINIELLKDALYSKVNAKDISEFQENNFDLSFVVDKNVKWKDISKTIEKTDTNIINKVELFDIYENEEKLPWKRSLSFKIYIQSMTKTLDDKVKNKLINEIIEKVNKKWWVLR